MLVLLKWKWRGALGPALNLTLVGGTIYSCISLYIPINFSPTQHVQVEEEVLWLPHCSDAVPDFETLMSWAQEGPRKLEISDETTFCEPKILKGVLSGKVGTR